MLKTLSLSLLLVFAALPLAGAVTYTITELPVPQGFSGLLPVAINASGQVAGYTGGITASFIYSNGITTVITGGQANGINASGQVVGEADNQHAYVYSGGAAIDLSGILGSGASSAQVINDSGQIAGYLNGHGFMLTGGAVLDLGSFSVTGINNAGQVVGNTANHRLLYTGGLLTDISAGPVFGINSSGQVIGVDSVTSQAFVYSNGVTTSLSSSAQAGAGSRPWGINDSGQIVGKADAYAALFTGGTVVNLNDLLPAGWALSTAYGINNAGRIIASGYDPVGNYQGAVLLTPVAAATPEPGTLGCLLLGCNLFAALRQAKAGRQRLHR